MGRIAQSLNKGVVCSPEQIWARRRNWEKRVLKEIYNELEFRLHSRWVENATRTQTASTEEIESMKNILNLLDSLISKWSHNYKNTNINLKNFK